MLKIKNLPVLSIWFVSALLLGTSCRKDNGDPFPGDPKAQRKIQFVLYSDQDFSKDYHTITFTLSIQKASNQVLWDSTLAPMQIREIPNFANKLVVEKLVPGNDNSLLKVGFSYSIEDIGNSWYYDASNPGENIKVVSYNFK